MMNKILLLFSALVLSATVNKAQTNVYHPFPTSNASWNVMYSGYQAPYCSDKKYYISGDTIVNALTYHKINYYGSQGSSNPQGYCDYWNYNSTEVYLGAFREDVAQKKVFFLLPSHTTDTLLYDFNLNVGDTIAPGINNNLAPEYMVISSIDSVLINSTYRKRFNIAETINVSIIEGIGSTSGLIEDIMIFEFGGNLYCYSENNQEVYPGTSSNPCQLITDNPELEKNNTFSIYPNPAKDRIYIDNSDGKTLEIALYNLLGECVLQKQLNKHEFEMDIETFVSGVYIIKVLGACTSFQKKLIIE